MSSHMAAEGNREFGNVELSYAYLLQWFDNYNIDSKNCRFLDIGTNRGTLPFLFYSRLGCYMEGIDCISERIHYGKERYPEIADRLAH